MNLYRAHHRLSLREETGQFINPYGDKPRNPVSMSKITHEICGKWFQQKFGINFRSRALFCTGDINQAKSYLNQETALITIRPVGDYQVCYSERTKDLFEHLKCGIFTGDSNSEEAVFDGLDSLGFMHHTNNGLEAAIASNNEVMLFCERYHFEIVKG